MTAFRAGCPFVRHQIGTYTLLASVKIGVQGVRSMHDLSGRMFFIAITQLNLCLLMGFVFDKERLSLKEKYVCKSLEAR